MLLSALCLTDKVKCTRRAHSNLMHHASSDLDNPYPRPTADLSSQIVSWITSIKHWDLEELASNFSINSVLFAIFLIEKNVAHDAILHLLIIPKLVVWRQFVYYPYCEQRVLVPFLRRGNDVKQNTVTEILKAEDAPGIALGTNIDTHVHVGHLAGDDFSDFSRELVRTVLGPVADADLDGAVRPRAAVASPPKSISVTPRLLDRCHRWFPPWSPRSRKYIAMLAVCCLELVLL